MSQRPLLCLLVLAMACAGCATPKPKDPTKPKDPKATPARKNMSDMTTDPSFVGFVGRLRIAVKQKDRNMISSMLDPDFGWRWDTPPAGETPFDYWDKNNLWPELEHLLAERFAPHEDYMVSPPAFVTDQSYRGFRCGMRLVNGSWRFAYFITGEDVLQ